jgi:hypothetical protein
MVMEGSIVNAMLPYYATAKPSQDFALYNLKFFSQTKLFIELYIRGIYYSSFFFFFFL